MNYKNSITLIDYMGSDKSHALAAWASTFAELDIPMPEDINLRVDALVNHVLNNGKRKRGVEDLLTFLANNHHNSPFRFSQFVFAMTTDVATHIHKLKHAVILEAENGESARYKELQEDKFYLPKDWIGIPVDKQHHNMNYIGSQVSANFGDYDWYKCLHDFSQLGNTLYHKAITDLTPILGKSRAKESARFFKTYNSQINTFNRFSFDGVLQFHQKRASGHAQKEVEFIANEMVRLIKEIPGNPFEYSLKAFNL